MKKVALVFVLAVFVPSLVLAWLAVRSLRDQQFVLERQTSLLHQSTADALAKEVQDLLADQQNVFRSHVDALLAGHDPQAIAALFDDRLRVSWPLAAVGFVVTLNGEILSPSPASRPEARLFCADNGRFLGNREAAEVYWNPKVALNNSLNGANFAANGGNSSWNSDLNSNAAVSQQQGNYSKSQQRRNVMPQKQVPVSSKVQLDEDQQVSKLAATEAEFRQLIGDSGDGALARFLDDKLNLLFWYRPPNDTSLVFGAQLALPRLIEQLKEAMKSFEPGFRDGVCVAILDDKAKPVAISLPGFTANWKHPFVATEIGEVLPHWEAAVYLTDPDALARSAQMVRLTFGLLIALLVATIAVGSWLIVRDLDRQLTLARQKTDFVSNVSHELKTPLTSIRMFSELLAEGRVTEPARQRSYLHIITAETARLTRLINNVLDFARMERGEKKYNLRECDLKSLLQKIEETYRPHLEHTGFQFACALPADGAWVRGDDDALSQVVVNLLSNAEKFSGPAKEIRIELAQTNGALPCAEIKVLDRGIGVPPGAGEKIFEQFHRAHDELSSGIQGSGLGLTLARQIARAHNGDVTYSAREGGGSCFTLRLPVVAGGASQPQGPDSQTTS